MKKIALLIATVFATAIGAQAQQGQPSTTTPVTENPTNVKLNVILHPTLSVELANYGNSGTLGHLEEADAVNLVYKTAADYTNGVSKTITNHLKATSIGSGFKINASASLDHLARTAGAGVATMDGTKVTVKVGGGAAKVIRDLGQSAQDMGYVVGNNNSTASTVGEFIDVTYAAGSLSSADVQNYLGADGNAARYTVNVVYTITAP